MKKITVLGSINMDLIFTVDQMPVKGETRFSEHFLMSPGGKGANQAVACAKQNVATNMLGSIGDDALSMMCQKALESYRVNCEYLYTVKDMTCGVAGIMIEDGDNRIIVDSGANQHHDITTIEKYISSLSNQDILISQLEIPINVIKQAFKTAQKQNVLTILNAAPSLKLDQEIYQTVDILIVNEIELEMQADMDINTKDDIKTAVMGMLKKGVGAVLVTLGENGCIYVTEDTWIDVPAYTVNVTDTTAAGDTFIGAFAAKLLHNNNIKEAMQFATAAAALTIQSLGAQRSIPTEDEVIAFIKKETNNE